MWRASPPLPDEIRSLRAARERLDLWPMAIHSNYLVNLASMDPEVRLKSIRSFRGELERAALLGAEYLVLHPGNYKNQLLEQGVDAFVLGLAEAASGLALPGLTVLLENTAGSGNQIGSRFEELRLIRELAAPATHVPIGYCLDTCHLLAAGFDIASESGLNSTLLSADEVLGFDLVRMIHANDSKGTLGSHLDRHENIGKGNIGETAFRRLLTHPFLKDKPFILETPVDDDEQARRDINALKRLSGLRRPRKPASRSAT